MSQSFRERLKAAKNTHSFRAEKTKLEFVKGITRLMKIKGISNSNLAEKLDTSAAYITKALRGDTNFTIDSMVKLTSALGAKLHIHVADSEASVRWFEAHTPATSSEIGTPQPFIAPSKCEVIDIKRILNEIENEKRQSYA